ncbi:MAG: hypothetical protein P8104_09535, partial [Gammaproteobacteria bacterium]
SFFRYQSATTRDAAIPCTPAQNARFKNKARNDLKNRHTAPIRLNTSPNEARLILYALYTSLERKLRAQSAYMMRGNRKVRQNRFVRNVMSQDHPTSRSHDPWKLLYH